MFLLKKYWGNIYFGQNRFWVKQMSSKNVFSKQIFGKKIFWFNKSLILNKCKPKKGLVLKIWANKKFGSNIFWVKNFWIAFVG